MSRRAVFHQLTVADVQRLTDDAVAVTFDVPEELAEEYRFAPGQHLTVRARLDGEEVRRNYSICAPDSAGTLQIAVKRLEEGTFSSYAVERLAPGDVLDVMTPTGRFRAEPDPTRARHVCAIAAGSGITPVLSIVASTLQAEPQGNVTLIYANRSTRSVMFLEELEDLKDRYPDRFHLMHVLSREPQDVDLFSGRLDGERLRQLLGTLLPVHTVDDWFMCGPYDMMTELRAVLVEAGVLARHVHTELFHVESSPRPRQVVRPPGRREAADQDGEEGADVTIVLDGRRSRFRLPGDGVPVLEAALRTRGDAPFACRGGVCGTCRAKVLEGSVAMEQNWALEPDELERGYVLTCQSHPITDTVVLDYDA